MMLFDSRKYYYIAFCGEDKSKRHENGTCKERKHFGTRNESKVRRGKRQY